jgi:hypothetical protein
VEEEIATYANMQIWQGKKEAKQQTHIAGKRGISFHPTKKKKCNQPEKRFPPRSSPTFSPARSRRYNSSKQKHLKS